MEDSVKIMGKFKVAAIFSDNMVLQRNKPIAIFGEGINDTTVKVVIKYKENEIYKESVEQTTVSDGRWLLYLPAMKENNDCSMIVTDGENVKEFKNIAIGEVWLCGGQSNMEFELQNIIGGEEYLENDSPNVRFYYTTKRAYMDEDFHKDEERTVWTEFDSETARNWSGIGYLYGKKLSETLGVTVGLVGCNWGGTSASAWMSEEYLKKDKDTFTYLEDYRKANEGKSEEEQIKEYDEYILFEAEWNKKCDHLYATVPGITWEEVQERIGVCRWPGPVNCKSPFRPSGLYRTMLSRVMPYSMKGWIYYQGESDDHKPSYYYKLFKLLIEQWRADWKDEQMPFLFVQLTGHQYDVNDDPKHWCIIREAQAKVADTVKNTGMAVIIDAGAFADIHPKDKLTVADRLYRQAMHKVYGSMKAAEAESPAYDNHVIDGNQCIISFKNAPDGLVVRSEAVSAVVEDETFKNDKEHIIGFEIAGVDKIYYPAKAWLLDEKKVIVSADEVENPVAVRYLWCNYPVKGVNLYSKYGLPVAPFRSNVVDEEVLHDTKIRQIMEL